MEIQDSDGVKYVVNLPSGMTTSGTRVAVVNTENGPVTVIFMDEAQDSSTSGETNLSGADALSDILNMPGVEVSVMDGDMAQHSTTESFVQDTEPQNSVQNTTSQNFVQDTASQSFAQGTMTESFVLEATSEHQSTTSQNFIQDATAQNFNQDLTVETVQKLRNETPGLLKSSLDQVDGHEFYDSTENRYGGGNVASLVSSSEEAFIDSNLLKDMGAPKNLAESHQLDELIKAESSGLVLKSLSDTSAQNTESNHNDILGQAILSASLDSSIIPKPVSKQENNKSYDLKVTATGQHLDSVLNTTTDNYTQYTTGVASSLKFRCTLCAESFEKMSLLLKHRADDHAINTGIENITITNTKAKHSIEDNESLVGDIKDIQENVQFQKETEKGSVLQNKKNIAMTQKKLFSSKFSLTSDKKKIHRIMKPVKNPDHSCGFKVVLRSSLNNKQLERFSFRKNEFCNVNHAVHEALIRNQSQDERLLNMPPKEIFFKCVYCHQCFTDRAETKRHVSVHRTVCSECGMKCVDLARLRRHRLSVHKSTKDGVYDCNYCKKKFGNKPDLMSHMKIHVGPWICERKDCGVQFDERKYLVQHRKSHGHHYPEKGMGVFGTSEKMEKPEGLTTVNVDNYIEQKTSFKDTDCGRVWAPARCKICREQFTRVSMVRKHIKMVHFDRDAKKLQCDQCDYKTQFGYVLEKHKQVHCKQYKCDICTKTFDYESSLKNHQATHAKARFQCYYCAQRFITREKCIEHLTSVHKDVKTKSETKSEKDGQAVKTKVENKRGVDKVDKAAIEGKKLERKDTKLDKQNEELSDSKASKISQLSRDKAEANSSVEKPDKMESGTELKQVASEMGMNLKNVTYIDSHGQSVQDLVVPGKEPEVMPSKPGYHIAPQTIQVPNSDVTLDLLADGTIITKDKQGTNFSEIKLETLGIDLNSLEGQTNIELVIVQSDGTEVKATIQAMIEKNQKKSPVKAKVSEPTLAALNSVDNPVDNVVNNNADNTVNTDNTEQNNTTEERLFKCSKCPRTFKYFNTYKCHESVHDRDVTYTCPLCFRVFAKSKNLTTHLELHKAKLGEEKYLSVMKETDESEIAAVELSKTKEFKCDQCTKVFPEKLKLTRHVKRCHEPKNYISCPHCSKEFLNKKSYDKHIATHTGTSNCSVCGESFSTDQELSDHLKGKHLVKKPEASSRTHICPICQISQGSRQNYSKHLRQEHGNNEEAKKLLDELKVFKCDICSARFERNSKLKAHIMTHTRGRKYTCQHCLEKFDSRQRLFDHYRQDHNNELKNPCKICMKNFLTKDKLSEHNKKFHSKSYRCGTCEQLFADYDLYCRHIFNEHSDGEARDLRNEIFRTKKSLLVHASDKHAKKTKHVCGVCGEEFTKASELRNHEIEEHAEDTVWDMENDTVISDPNSTLKCDLCNFEVCDESLFRQHYLIKHFKGDEEAMQNEYPHLIRTIDSGQSLIICDHCGNDFPGIDELNMHLTSLGLETLTYIDNKEKEISPKRKNKENHKIYNDLTSPKDRQFESDEEFDEVEINEDEEYMPVKDKKLGGKRKSKTLSSKKAVKSDDKESFLGSNFNLGKIDEQGNSPLKSHKCYICGEKFSTEKALMKHAESHDDESDIDEQIKKENNIKPMAFKCYKCGNSYATAFGLKTHNRHKHSDSLALKNSKMKKKKSQGKLNTYIGLFKKKLPMTTLKDKNSNKDFTKTPVKTEQMSPARVSTSGRIIKKSLKTIDQMQCEICFKQFSHESSLLKHMVNRHQLNTSSSLGEARDNDNSAMTANVDGTFCKICKGTFKNFGSHLYQKHKDLYYESKLKKETSSNIIQGERHFLLSESEESEVKLTTRELKAESYSSSNFKFMCKSCPRKFKTDNLLKLHTKSHKMKDILKAANKPIEPDINVEEKDAIKAAVGNKELCLLLYKCKSCSKSFGTRKILEAHVDENHSTSFKCKHCDKDFNNWRALSAHERFHHNVRKTLPKPQPKSPIKAVLNQSSMQNNFQSPKGDQDKNKPIAKQSKYEKVTDTKQEDKAGQVKMFCNICNISFDDRASLMDHMMSHTSISNDQIKQKLPLSKRTRLSSDTQIQQPVKEKTPTRKQEKAAKYSPSLTRAKAADIKMSTNKTNTKKENINIKRKLEEDQNTNNDLPQKKKKLDNDVKNSKKDSVTIQKDLNQEVPKQQKINLEIPKKKIKQEIPKKMIKREFPKTQKINQEIPKKIKQEIPKKKIKQEFPDQKINQEVQKKKIKQDVQKKKIKQEVQKKKIKQEVQKKDGHSNKKNKLEAKKVTKNRKLAVGLFRKKLIVANKKVVNIAKKISIPEIKCVICKKHFKHLHAKQVHMINVHKRIANSVKDKYCKKCKILYKSDLKLQQHKKIAHREVVKKKVKESAVKKQVHKQPVGGKKKVKNSTDVEIFPCSQCTAKFTSDRGLKIHHKKVHGWQTAFSKTGIRQQCLMCLECQKLFKSGYEYKDHLKTFHTMEIVDNGILKTITSTELEVEIKKEVIDEEFGGEKGGLFEQTTHTHASSYLPCKICSIVVGTDLQLSEHVKSFHPEILVNPIEDLSLGTSSAGSDVNMEGEVPALDKEIGQSVKKREATDSNTSIPKEVPYPVSCVVVDVDTSLMNSPQLFSVPVIKLDRLNSVKKQIVLKEDKSNRPVPDVYNSNSNDNELEQEMSVISKEDNSIESYTGDSNGGDTDNSTNETGLVITNTIGEAGTVYNTENIPCDTENHIATLGHASDKDKSVSADFAGTITDHCEEMTECTELTYVNEDDSVSENIPSMDDMHLASLGTDSNPVENTSNAFIMDIHTDLVDDQRLVNKPDVLVGTDNIVNEPEKETDGLGIGISTENVSGSLVTGEGIELKNKISAESERDVDTVNAFLNEAEKELAAVDTVSTEEISTGNGDVNTATNEESNMYNVTKQSKENDRGVEIVNNTEEQKVTAVNKNYVEDGVSSTGDVLENNDTSDITKQCAEHEMGGNETEKEQLPEANQNDVGKGVYGTEEFHEVSEQAVEMNAITEQSAKDIISEDNENNIENAIYGTSSFMAVDEQVVAMNDIAEHSSINEIDASESMIAYTSRETDIIDTQIEIVNNELESEVSEMEVSEPLVSNTYFDTNHDVNAHSELISAKCEVIEEVSEPLSSNADLNTNHVINAHSDDVNSELLNSSIELNTYVSEPLISNTHLSPYNTDNTNSEHESMEVDSNNREIGYLGIKIGLGGREISLEETTVEDS